MIQMASHTPLSEAQGAWAILSLASLSGDGICSDKAAKRPKHHIPVTTVKPVCSTVLPYSGTYHDISS